MYKCFVPEYWIDSNLEVWKTVRSKKDNDETTEDTGENKTEDKAVIETEGDAENKKEKDLNKQEEASRVREENSNEQEVNSSKQEYELTNNKKFMYDTWISHWIDEGRGYKDRVEKITNLSKSDLFAFMDRFLKLEFCCENVVEEVTAAIELEDDNVKNIKELLYISICRNILQNMSVLILIPKR